MAEQQPTAPVYESAFTSDAISGLTNHLQKALYDYAQVNGKDGKMDFFVLYAALAQTAYEMSYNALPRDEDDRTQSRAEVAKIVDGLLAKIDGVRAEFKTRQTSDLMAAAQFTGILAEIYCKRRDNALIKAMEDQQLNTEHVEAQQ